MIDRRTACSKHRGEHVGAEGLGLDTVDNLCIGYFGEASQELGFKTLSCLLEVDLDVLIEKSNFIKKYQNLPQYPTVFRDLAVIVNEETPWSSIEKCIMDAKVALVREINFFDVYRGKQIPAGKKSVAFNLCFQAKIGH